MPKMTTEHVILSSDEQTELGQYRSISRLAIAALFAGLASALAMAHPVLWSLPPLAAVLSVLAVRHVARHESVLTGHWMAVVGLVLALVCGAASISRVVAARRIVRAQAQQVAVAWLQLLRDGKHEEAIEWTVVPYRRRPGGVNLDEFYQNDAEARATRQKFLRQDTVKNLLASNPAAPLELLKVVEQGGRGSEHHIILQYRVKGQDQTPFEFRIHLQRQETEPRGDVEWRVISLQEPD